MIREGKNFRELLAYLEGDEQQRSVQRGGEQLSSEKISSEQLEKLCRYAELVEIWSKRHNLVSFHSRRELVERHLGEALEGAGQLGEEGVLLDIGSGAGLPGVPLLIARPGWRGVLLEPRQKRWAFLKLVIREIGLNAEVVRARYQDLGDKNGKVRGDKVRFDLVTIRALTVDRELLRYARLVLKRHGMVLVWGTEDILEKLRDHSGWHVLSSPLASRDTTRLVRLEPCFT